MTVLSATSTSLVVGAGGMIGRALAEHLERQGRRVVRTTRSPDPNALTLDLSKDVSAWTPPSDVETAYLCAAVVSLDQCRKDPAAAFAVNVTGTVSLARSLLQRGAHVVFLSTNLVFDGSLARPRSDAPVAPRTEYGRQKAEAERQLMALSDRVSIVRLSKVMGPRTPLLSRWAEDLRQGRTIHPFSDMPVAPVPLDFVVEVLFRVGQERLQGILHVSGQEEVTYEAVAHRIAQRLGAPQRLVVPIPAAASGLNLEHVPRHAALDITRLQSELGMTPPDIWTTIDKGFA